MSDKNTSKEDTFTKIADEIKAGAVATGKEAYKLYKDYSYHSWKNPFTRHDKIKTYSQVAAAVGTAAAGGAGVSGSVMAGVGVVTTKVAAVVALGTAALPVVATVIGVGLVAGVIATAVEESSKNGTENKK